MAHRMAGYGKKPIINAETLDPAHRPRRSGLLPCKATFTLDEDLKTRLIEYLHDVDAHLRHTCPDASAVWATATTVASAVNIAPYVSREPDLSPLVAMPTLTTSEFATRDYTMVSRAEATNYDMAALEENVRALVLIYSMDRHAHEAYNVAVQPFAADIPDACKAMIDYQARSLDARSQALVEQLTRVSIIRRKSAIDFDQDMPRDELITLLTSPVIGTTDMFYSN